MDAETKGPERIWLHHSTPGILGMTRRVRDDDTAYIRADLYEEAMGLLTRMFRPHGPPWPESVELRHKARALIERHKAASQEETDGC